ncbi:MAG: hypothetical protein ABIH23_13625, partial [bacterium]
ASLLTVLVSFLAGYGFSRYRSRTLTISAFALIIIRMLRSFLDVPLGEQIPPWNSLVSSFVCIGPLGGLVGFAFPLAVVVYRRLIGANEESNAWAGAAVSVVYTLESLGGLIAGALLSFYLVGRFETIPILMWVIVLAGFVAHILTSDLRLGWYLLILSAIVLVFSTSGGALALDNWSNRQRWMGIASGELIESIETPYQHLDVGRTSGQCNLYGNGSFLFSFPDPYTEEIDANLWMSLHPDPRRVMLIGGLGGRYLPALLKHGLDRVDYVEPDASVIGVVRRESGDELRDAFNAKNVQVHTTDGRRFLRETKEQYDVVIVNVPDPSTALLNRFYTKEFYKEIERVLAPGGLLIASVDAPGSYLAGEVGAYAASVYWTISDSYAHVGILPNGSITFVACQTELPPLDNPEFFVERLESREISSKTFVPEAILTRILPDRAQTVGEFLKTFRAVARNSDLSPQSYLHRLILWGRESGSESLAVGLGWLDGHRHFLLLLFLLAASLPWSFLGMAPKQASLIASVIAVGCVGMGLELVAVYMYQNLYGFLYQEIGFLIAIFMAGLAAGAQLGRWIARGSLEPGALVKLLIVMVVFAFLFPWFLLLIATINPEHIVGATLYGTLILITGILVGAVFPVAVAISTASRERKAGRWVALLDAADHLGGALGAFLPGVILFPLFGVIWTCIWLGVGLAFVALGFLLAVYLERA